MATNAYDRMSRAGGRLALVIALMIVLVPCAVEPSPGNRVTVAPQSGEGGSRTPVTVVAVTDGDTIRVDLQGAETPVRLIGIDTPEKDGPYTDEECYGEQASRYTADALEGREVELEFDLERTDRFDRTLAYVWLDGALFNEQIVREGYAMQATFPPNVRYVERFTQAQRQAATTTPACGAPVPPREAPLVRPVA